MRAVLRLGLGIAAAALAVTSAPARAQDADPATNNSSGTVGPRELEDFSINGTVTTPAPTPAQPAPRPQPPATTTRPPATATPTQSRPSAPTPERAIETAPVDRSAPRAAPAPAPSETIRQTPPGGSVTVALPTMDGADRATADGAPVVLPAPATGGSPSFLPWALALLALAGGAAFFLWQRRERPAFAGGPELEDYIAAEPAPSPAPRAPRADPVPTTAPVPVDDAFAGFVSTRLRPWLELGFKPTRCSVEDDKVTIEFEIEVQNRGNAPARAVLIEARMVNAGIEQDGEIGAFFANPVGQGDRIPSIDPLKSIQIKSQIVTSRDQVQVYEVGGRSVFVPLLAFNILYEWARGQGQTSASYLVGRETKSDKMAPFRLDLGPRLFRTLDTRPLPLEVRH